MGISKSLRLLAVCVGIASACPPLQKRQTVNATQEEEDPRFWAYEASYDWGRLHPDWELCQTGTQQSPIPLRLDQGLSRNHVMDFKYPSNATGGFYNWGYGPKYALDHPEDVYTTLPQVQFDEDNKNETVYLAEWHIHSPADHTVQGDRSKAELHLVHTDAEGKPRAVLAIRIDPGNSDSQFLRQLPPMLGFNSTKGDKTDEVVVDHNLLLNEVNNFADFWTYKGSLTSPPCTEGLRWFVARNIMFVSDNQMQAILKVSTFSARPEQEVWRHDINV